MFWKLLILILLLPVVQPKTKCLNAGVLSQAGDKCFHTVAARESFIDAEGVCGIIDSELVSVTNAFESQDVLTSVHLRIPVGDFWIGLTDLYTENIWRWEDGRVSNYTNWATGFPKNDSSLRCATVQWSSGKWYNVNCTSHIAYFVCESYPIEVIDHCTLPTLEAINQCYTMNIVPQTYQNAEAVCAEFGGSLVEPINDLEQQKLMALAKEHFHGADYWIGVTDPFGSGDFQYYDGTPVNYTRWAAGFPEKSAEQTCVAVRILDGTWYNTNCENRKFSVCQQPKAKDPCLPEWERFEDSCYKLESGNRFNYSVAKQICKNLNAHCTTVLSKVEQYFLHDLAEGRPYWAGFEKIGSGWVWSDGSALTSFNPWEPPQPDNCCGDPSCTHGNYDNRFGLDDRDCAYLLNDTICKRPTEN